jgi:hypothetical protein
MLYLSFNLEVNILKDFAQESSSKRDQFHHN